MTDKHTTGSTDDSADVRTDGGVAAQQEADTDYLQTEINLLNPTTPFMQDHLRIVWTGFAIWLIATFGPPTLTFIAPDAMSSQLPALGFPLHYFLLAIVAPTTSLILCFWYARKRDALDEKYGIDHGTPGEADGDAAAGETAATDGGVEQ